MTTVSAAFPQGDAGEAYRRGLALLGRNWGWLMFRGVLALALGVVAFLFPLSAVFAFTLVFAAYAGADGILSIIAGIRGATHKEERWWGLILRGVIGLAVAVLFVLMPVIATLSYALVTLSMLIAWAVLTGIFEIAAAIRLRKAIEGEWMLAISGGLSVLLGVLVWAMLFAAPLTSLLSVGWLIGAYALFAGIVLVSLALRLRRLQRFAHDS